MSGRYDDRDVVLGLEVRHLYRARHHLGALGDPPVFSREQTHLLAGLADLVEDFPGQQPQRRAVYAFLGLEQRLQGGHGFPRVRRAVVVDDFALDFSGLGEPLVRLSHILMSDAYCDVAEVGRALELGFALLLEEVDVEVYDHVQDRDAQVLVLQLGALRLDFHRVLLMGAYHDQLLYFRLDPQLAGSVRVEFLHELLSKLLRAPGSLGLRGKA